jgi:acetyl esterase/lipase
MPLQRRTTLAVLAALIGVGFSDCAAPTVLNAIEPKFGVETKRNVAYAPGPRHAADIYSPRKNGARAPVVVFIYGGGWDSGSKAQYGFVGAALAAHGYVTVVPDYRIYPQAHYPDFLQDCALAVRWAYDHAADYGGDPSRIFLIGHSAGAYNAVMLGLDPRWLAAVGLNAHRDIEGVVGLAGPYDFLPLESDKLRAIFGVDGQMPDSQPINHVDGRQPPMLLVHDLDDTVVYARNTERLAAKIHAIGGEVETRYYKGLSHALVIGVFATPLRFMAPVFRDATQFIDAHAAAAPRTP